MSQLMIFNFEDSEVPVFIDSNAIVWLHAPTACKVLNLKNPTLVVQRHVSDKHRKQIAVGVGMPAWYVTEPGFYQLVFRSKSEQAERFQDWVFEEVLPSIRNNGGYISPDATNEQLQSLQKQITDLQQQNSLLAQEHCYHELVNRFVVDNFIFKEGAYVMPNVVYDRFIYWYQNAELIDHLKVDGVPRLDKGRLFKELDRHFKTKQPKGSKKGFHFDPKNGFGDLENCQLVPKGKIGRFNHTTVYQLG